MSAELAIHVAHLSKHFKGQRAVDDVSFDVKQGKFSACWGRMELVKQRFYVC